MVKAQEWLEENYSLEKRKKTINLSITEKNLEGDLNLKDFTNLAELYCAGTNITSLDISNCEKIVRIEVWRNQLSNLILPPKGEEIYCIDVSSNKLTDLTIFEHLVSCSCEELAISNNPFSGSLKPLRNLKKLGRLVVKNTNLDSGLEYLPDKLIYLSCDGKLAEILEGYLKSKLFNDYDYQVWKKDNQEKINKIIELENSLDNLQMVLVNQTLNENTDKTLQLFIYQTEEKIKGLRKALCEKNKQQLETKIEIPPK